jgi:hypothetical protein
MLVHSDQRWRSQQGFFLLTWPGSVLDEVTVGPFAFPSSFSFLLFLVEGIFGGFSGRFLLPGFVKAIRVQLLLVGNVDLGDR